MEVLNNANYELVRHMSNISELKLIFDTDLAFFAPLQLNFTQLLTFVAALLVSVQGQVQNALKLADQGKRGLQKEIQTIKQPVDETIAYVGETQCSNVKKLIGVDYEQVAGIKEPDLNELTLNFISKELQVVYNLTSAARLLSERREFNPRAKLIIFIHGFTDSPNKLNFKGISEAFLKMGEYNILGLDASSLIRWLYLHSTTYVRFIGESLGDVLAAMIMKGLAPGSIHLIGHSLGAHIAGFTGKRVQASGARVGRVSGLDPAGPCFTIIEPELRLKYTDADFVDVIHTDAGVYGISECVGHVDFFPNEGKEQPNCLFQSCSHSRAVELYAESIMKHDSFVGKACNDYDNFKNNKCKEEYSVMGYACKPETRGKFYLRTGEDQPYGLGLEGTTYKNNDGIIKNIGSAIFG